MGKSQFDEPMTFAKWWAIRSSALLELKLTPAQWYEKFAGTNIDTGGTPQLMLNTSGEITETRSSNIDTNTTNIYTLGKWIGFPHFGAQSASATLSTNVERRIMCTAITATAGGEIVSAPIAPALASYQTACRLTHIWSDQTDGSINLAFGTTSGLSNGPATVNIATTANTVAPDFNQGIYFYGSADNEAINVSAAAGQTVASQAFIFIGEYWFET